MMIHTQFLPRLVMLACICFTHFACTTSNGQFCNSEDDCGAGRACLGGTCETSLDAPDGAAITPTCNDEDHSCVENAPGGWSGPAIAIDQAGGASVQCPADFDGQQIVGFEGLQASGSCGCSCGDTTNFTCLNGALEGRDGPIDFPTCFADCVAGDCVKQTLSPGLCSTISSSVLSQDLLRLNDGVVTGGTCGAGTISNLLDEPTFDTQVTLCVAELSAQSCPEESSCVAVPPSGQDICIFQEGEHECPSESIYQDRRVIFAGYDDQRSCDTCDCEAGDIGGACGSVEVFNNDFFCQGTPSDSICTNMPVLVDPRAKFTRRTSLSCNATIDPPISGDVLSVGATTLCCAR